MAAATYRPSMREAEAEEMPQVQGMPEEESETLYYK